MNIGAAFFVHTYETDGDDDKSVDYIYDMNEDKLIKLDIKGADSIDSIKQTENGDYMILSSVYDGDKSNYKISLLEKGKAKDLLDVNSSLASYKPDLFLTSTFMVTGDKIFLQFMSEDNCYEAEYDLNSKDISVKECGSFYDEYRTAASIQVGRDATQ